MGEDTWCDGLILFATIHALCHIIKSTSPDHVFYIESGGECITIFQIILPKKKLYNKPTSKGIPPAFCQRRILVSI